MKRYQQPSCRIKHRGAGHRLRVHWQDRRNFCIWKYFDIWNSQKGQSNNRCKFIVNENLYFAYSCKHWIILKNFIINLLKKLLAYTFCCNQYQSKNEGFPSNLNDRPWEFVLHCLERRKIALGSDWWRITSQEKDLFAVLSFTNNLSKCYKIYSWN